MGNPYISLLKMAWNYAGKERKLFIMIYAMFVIANLVLAMNPLLYGWFINGLQQEGAAGLRYAWIYALGFLGLKLLEWTFHGPARVMERRLAFRVSRNFMEEQYHKIVHLPIKWHQDHHTGATINRVRKGYEALKDFFQNGFIYLYAIGKFFFSFAAMLYFSPVFGCIAVMLGVLTIVVLVKFDKPYIQSLKELNKRENEVSSSLFDSLSNIVTVITLRLEKSMEDSILRKVFQVFPPFNRNVVVNEWKWFVAQMLIALIYAVIVFGYVFQNWKSGEPFMIGGLVMLIGFVNQFTGVFNDIAAQYNRLLQYNTDVQMATSLGEEYLKQGAAGTEAALPENWKHLEINHLNFFRNESGEHATGLKNMHLHLARGKRIALIGESGSGKSTLLALLRGLYQPEPGVLVISDNGTPASFSAVGNTVTLFPQEPEIFENTILYNITLGLPFTEEEVMEVCNTAQFADVVKRLPHGLHTHIQEKGVNLSGGQKQRLALARGILAARSSEIVLLDEPTSSVDPKTEKLIYHKMFQSFSGKVVISSLHRMHLLTQFDYIYILKDGHVIDEGTFRDLRIRSVPFQELWQHQEDQLVSVE